MRIPKDRRVPVLKDALHRRHLVLQLGALAHAPLEHAGETDTLRDRQTYVSAVHRAATVAVHHEEAQRDQHDVQHAENIQPEAEGARGRDKKIPRR